VFVFIFCLVPEVILRAVPTALCEAVQTWYGMIRRSVKLATPIIQFDRFWTPVFPLPFRSARQKRSARTSRGAIRSAAKNPPMKVSAYLRMRGTLHMMRNSGEAAAKKRM